MKLQFLGCGNAFSVANQHSNIFLTQGNSGMLIDCGTDIKYTIRQIDQDIEKAVKKIDNVYISHLHLDHFGGLEWLGIVSKHFGHKITLIIQENLLHYLWTLLKPGLGTGFKSENNDLLQVPLLLRDYFYVHAIPFGVKNGFICLSTNFKLIEKSHSFLPENYIPSYGLQWQGDSKSVYFSSDGYFDIDDVERCKQNDIIFHDCSQIDPNPLHATYKDIKEMLCGFFPPIGPPNNERLELRKKIWLYHYQDVEKPDCVKDGFAGWVQKGQIFEV